MNSNSWWKIKDQQPEEKIIFVDNLKIKKAKVFNSVEMYFHKYNDIERFDTPIRIPPKSIRIDYVYAGIVNNKNTEQNLYLEPHLLKVDQRSLDSGDYCFMNGNFDGVTILLNLSIRDDELEKLIGEFHGWVDFHHSEEYFFLKSNFISNLFEDLRSENIQDSLIWLKLKMAELILYLKSVKSFDDFVSPTQLFSRDNMIFKDIIKYLANNLNKQTTLQFLSTKFHISQTKLKALFKTTYKQTFYNYYTTQKMNYAAKLLIQTDMKVSLIAEKVGYKSSSKFSAAFQAKKYSTPRNFRNKFKRIRAR